MTSSNWLLIPIMAWSFVGCTKMSPAQISLDQVNGGLIDKSTRPACEIQTAEYALDTKMVAFELTDSAGVHVGFDLISGFLKLLSLDFKASSGNMIMAMSLYDPMVPKYELLNVKGDGTYLSFGVEVDAGFQNIGAGFSVAHKTSLATLAEKSLTNTFDNLTTQMTTLQQPWHTEVVAIPSQDTVVVPIGSYGNLKIGDQFAIYNVDHVWRGKACASDHIIARKTTTDPLALAEVTQLANNGAVLTLMCSEENPCRHDIAILAGASAQISKLTDEKRTLYRLIEIRNVIGAEIPFEDAKKVDISPYLQDQIRAVAHTYGFMVYQP